mmetsp:Transcript_12907/g.21148  ORF Transcript_12907/g.21148 Transcript_12907/m.21148 type:complete len:85 (-) Transcript_12907:236-490(-)
MIEEPDAGGETKWKVAAEGCLEEICLARMVMVGNVEVVLVQMLLEWTTEGMTIAVEVFYLSSLHTELGEHKGCVHAAEQLCSLR